MSYEKMFFLSGLPRSGSTMVSAILSENPDIHTEGISVLCKTMCNLDFLFNNEFFEQINANNKTENILKIVSSIPQQYYYPISNKYVIDKNRSWTFKYSLEIIKKYINKDPKIVVLTRKSEDIVCSFLKLNNDRRNKKIFNEENILNLQNSPLIESIQGLLEAKTNKENNYLFIDYDDFINNPEFCLGKIYNFYEIDYFKHDLNNIVMKNPENDSFYGIFNLHKIKNTIQKTEHVIDLSDYALKKCNILNKKIYS